MWFSLAGGDMFVRGIDGNYPRWQQVIPPENPMQMVRENPEDEKSKMIAVPAPVLKVRFNSAAFLKLLEGALPITQEKTNRIVLDVKKGIESGTVFTLEADNPETGHYEWHLPAEAEGLAEGGHFRTGVNAYYLIDALQSFPMETTGIRMTDALSPILVNASAVVMPMRI